MLNKIEYFFVLVLIGICKGHMMQRRLDQEMPQQPVRTNRPLVETDVEQGGHFMASIPTRERELISPTTPSMEVTKKQETKDKFVLREGRIKVSKHSEGETTKYDLHSFVFKVGEGYNVTNATTYGRTVMTSSENNAIMANIGNLLNQIANSNLTQEDFRRLHTVLVLWHRRVASRLAARWNVANDNSNDDEDY
jgi:hypothetical protein